MPEFREWSAWLESLTPADRGAAWTAVGVVAASAQAPFLESPPEALSSGEIRRVLAACWAERRVNPDWPSAAWAFPVRAEYAAVLKSAPEDWATAWRASAPKQRRLRVRVPAFDEFENRPWWPQDEGADAITLVAPLPAAPLVVEWPLRLTALPGSADAKTLEDVVARWPSNTLTRIVPIDRASHDSDILVHTGALADLVAAARRLPFRIKTDLIVQVGGAGKSWQKEADGALQAFAANGIIGVRPRSDLAGALNAFVEHLSHNVPLDAASFRAFQGTAGAAYLTDALADTRLIEIARRLDRKMAKMAPGAAIDLSKVRGTAVRKNGGSAPPRVNLDNLEFHSESASASDLATMSMAAEAAVEPAPVEARRAERYLQQQSFLVGADATRTDAKDGFVAGAPAQIDIRIGPPETGWQGLTREFDTSTLPQDEQQWQLDVWLTEPDQLETPRHSTITLPRDGASTIATFSFAPRAAGRFDARVTVLHRGRVLQTATLRAGVRKNPQDAIEDASPVLLEPLRVRKQIDGLDQRTQFDLAVVLNHTSTNTPLAVSIAADAAAITRLDQALQIAAKISTILGRLGTSALDYTDGIESTDGRELLRDAAREGVALHFSLFNQQANHFNRSLRDAEYIQVVNTEAESLIPFELIYDLTFPDDDAAICPTWRACVAAGACSQPPSKRVICPMGFWGLRKVIERHVVSPQLFASGRRLFLQSVPQRGRNQVKVSGVAVVASSNRVTVPLTPLLNAVSARAGSTPKHARSWTEWVTAVGQAHPGLLIAMPHSGGSGSTLSLEIDGDPLFALQLDAAHVRAGDTGHPLVALLGCDTGNAAGDYLSHVAVFQDRGAAVVIGTLATVFGDHAPRVAQQLAGSLIPEAGAPAVTVGEAMRQLRRQALLDKFLLPMCIVAFGDADWELVH